MYLWEGGVHFSNANPSTVCSSIDFFLLSVMDSKEACRTQKKGYRVAASRGVRDSPTLVSSKALMLGVGT